MRDFLIWKEQKENSQELTKITADRENLKNLIQNTLDKNEELKNLINGFEREKARLTERQEAYKRDTADKKERLVTANEKLTRTKEYSKRI